MAKQDSKTIEREKTSYSPNTRSSRSSEPPGWSALYKKATKNISLGKFSSKTLGYIFATLALGFGTSLIPFLAFSIPGGWFTTIFIISLFGSIIGKGSYASSAISGGLILGTYALLTGFVWAILSGGITVIISVILGALIGLFGTELGNKLT